MPTLTPLHVSSHWSPGRGVAAPSELARRAAAAGLGALVLSDFESLAGQVEHHAFCRANGVRPVTGLALGGGPRSRPRLIMLAENAAGYRSLCRIVARRRTERPDLPGGDPVRDAAAEPAGLFALSEDPAAIRALAGAGFPLERARVLLARPQDDPDRERRVVADARRLGVPLAALPRLALARRGDLELLWLRRAIRDGRNLSGAAARWGERMARADALPFGASAELFSDAPEAVTEAEALLERCETVDLGRDVTPLDAAGERDAAEAFAQRMRGALAAARARGHCLGDAYRDRLERELRVVRGVGLAGWFLAVDELARHLRDRRIDAIARGSAAGSLVVHLLGLGPVDPVATGLIFERFLHEGRREPPDLDLDLPSSERDEVSAWVAARWPGRVAMVASHQRFRARAAWRAGLHALGADPRRADELCRALPHDEEPPRAWLARAAEAVPPGTRAFLPHVPRLNGAPSHLSTHPGAIVLTAAGTADVLPVQASPKGVPVTQYDGTSLDALGVVRLDLLGSRSLDVLRRARQLASPPDTGAPAANASEADALPAAGARRPRDADGLRTLDDIPDDDEDTFALLDAGDTVGCFQVETPATRQVLRRRSVTDLASLTAALAAVRPGPAGGERLDAPLFEEDVMRELAAAGGLELGEADLVRSAIVRTGEDPAALARLGARYVREAVRRGGEARRADAERAWERASAFAAYAFSKAHASSHALLAYRSTWMRAHHPAAYAAALLDRYGGGYPRRSLAGAVARWGVAVRGPCVNRSAYLTVPAGETAIRLGLVRLRRIPDRFRRALLAERERGGPFRDLPDLIDRLAPSTGELAALVLSGAADALAPLSAEAYPFAHEHVTARYARGVRAPRAYATAPGGSGSGSAATTPAPAAADADRAGGGRTAPAARDAGAAAKYRALVRIRNELRFLGMHLAAHPMAVLRRDADEAGCVRAADVPGEGGVAPGDRVRVAGLLAATHRMKTESGQPLRFLTLEDETGWLEARLRGGEGDATARWTGGPYLVEGVYREHPDAHLDVERIAPFYRRAAASPGASRPSRNGGRG